MTLVKATRLDGTSIYLNLLEARMVVPNNGGGSSVIFGPDDAVDVQEAPEKLVRGEGRWPETPEGVGFIRRG